MEQSNASTLNDSLSALQQQWRAVHEFRIRMYTYGIPVGTAPINVFTEQTTLQFVLLLALLAVLMNACVLCACLFIDRNKVSASLRLNLSLVVSDIWTSIWVIANVLYDSYLPFVHNIDLGADNYCSSLTIELFRMSGFLICILHLVVLALNHCLSIALPFSYRKILSPTNTWLIIATAWLLPMLCLFAFSVSVPDGGYRSDRCMNLQQYHYPSYRYTISACIIAMVIAMCSIYTAVFCVLRRTRKKFARLQRASLTNGTMSSASMVVPKMSSASESQVRRERRMITTGILICGTFCFGWLPGAAQFALPCTQCGSTKSFNLIIFHFIFAFVALSAIMLKSIVNPVIYAVRIPEIKCQMEQVFGCVPIWGSRPPPSHGKRPRPSARLPHASKSRMMHSDAQVTITCRDSPQWTHSAENGPLLDQRTVTGGNEQDGDVFL